MFECAKGYSCVCSCKYVIVSICVFISRLFCMWVLTPVSACRVFVIIIQSLYLFVCVFVVR